MGKWIAFIRAKSFYVQVYRRLQPLLGPRPLVVTCNGRVLEACGRAEAEGVRAGIPLYQARCLCPQADVVTFRPDDCLLLYRKLWDIVAAHSPVVEPTGFHQGFTDVSKVVTDSYQATQWQKEVGKQIQQQTDLKSLVGVGPGKFVARVAAPRNAVVAEEHVREFLAPISLSDLDWLDSKLQDTLQRLGLTTLGQVTALDKAALIQQAGQLGGQLYDWIKGRDNCVVQALYPPLEERVAYAFDIEDREQVIIRVLGELCEQLADRLGNSGSQPRQITLRLEADAGYHAQTQQYSRLLKDAGQLYQAAQRLLKQLWQGQPLQSIEIVARDLQAVKPQQIDLWGGRRRRTVEQAMEAVRSRYGAQAVNQASQLEDKQRFAQMILGAKGRFSW